MIFADEEAVVGVAAGALMGGCYRMLRQGVDIRVWPGAIVAMVGGISVKNLKMFVWVGAMRDDEIEVDGSRA